MVNIIVYVQAIFLPGDHLAGDGEIVESAVRYGIAKILVETWKGTFCDAVIWIVL